MSMIRRLGTDEHHHLTWSTTIGRHSTCPICAANSCLLCLDDENVSLSHAELRWVDRGETRHWTVRHIGDTNPTWLNGDPIPPGVQIPLRPGDVLVFGSEAAGRYEVDTSPPRPLAIDVLSSHIIPGSVGHLYGDASATWEVVLGATGWELRQGEQSKRVRDGERVGSWSIRLPLLRPTLGPQVLSYYRATLTLSDPQAKGDWKLLVEQDNHRFDGGIYAPWRTLWALADRRVDDERRGLAPSEVGWMTLDEIADATGDKANNAEIQTKRVMEYLRDKVRPETPLPGGEPLIIQHAEQTISRRNGRFRLNIEAARLRLP